MQFDGLPWKTVRISRGETKNEERQKGVNSKRLCVFFIFSLIFLCFAGFARAQMALVNFRWLGDTGLALCGQPENSEQWETVKSWGVTAVVNLRGEAQDDEAYLNSIGIEHYYLPVITTPDAIWDVTEEQVDAGVQWINSKLAEGKKILIHCQLGQNRAPTMAMMWYIHEGHTEEEAYQWVMQYPISKPYEYHRQSAAAYYNWLQQKQTPTPAPNSEGFPTAIAAIASGAFITGVGLLIYVRKQKS
jgi:protein-tyrosine phosphatase